MGKDSEHDADAATYKVGYGKPPLETRFGAHRQPDRLKRTAVHDKKSDIAALLDDPLEVKIRGKRTKMHLHEATMHGLFKRVLKGEIQAIKAFLELCERAGLLKPPPRAPSSGVIAGPRGVPLELTGLLIREVGLPPWDEEVFASYKAKYDAESVHIAKLKEEALEKARSNGESVY
ncbi:hypothetical protein ABIB94_005562 [Bradyrhizobium sp. JR7.2]|uniref:DUF5681 domain-containing protein n=1 Tax=Bradyrhizobium sp. JR7.2 TaxID=3156375 RepID=UPI00339AA9FA